MKMVTGMKKMLDAAYNESAMPQATIYHWYEFRSSRKSAELINGSDASTTALTEQTIYPGTKLASLLDISVGSMYILNRAMSRWA